MPPLTREELESDAYLALPGKFEIHEWSIMDRFARSLEDNEQSAKLDRAIHRTGAFGRFRDELDELGLRDAWYRFRDDALTEIAADFLEAHGIPFVRDAPK